jgi:undecaprenyl-diphosphatase
MIDFVQKIDLMLFRFLNESIANPVFDLIMPFLTEEDNFIIPILLVWLSLIIFGGKRGRLAAVLLVLATAAADAIAYQILKPSFGRLRPCHALESVRLLVNCGGQYGFVSNHAANMFASMTTLGIFYRKSRPYLLGFAGLIAFTRVYVGVHYPGDVLFGGLLGFGLAYAFFSLLVLLNNYLRKQEKLWLEWRTPPPDTL